MTSDSSPSRPCLSTTRRRSTTALASRPALLASLPIGLTRLRFGQSPGAAAQWTALVESGMRPLDDVMLLRFGMLGSPQYADDRLPEIDAPLLPRAAGIQPPLVRGYDRAFFLKHRVFPPLSPAANPQLASLAVPLVTESDVLVAARSVAGRGSIAADQASCATRILSRR